MRYSNNSTAIRQMTRFFKWAKDLNRYFSKEDIQMANEYTGWCSTSMINREVQTETTVRYHIIHVGIAITKKTKKKCWWDVNRREPLWQEGRPVRTLQKPVWRLRKRLGLELPCGPVAPSRYASSGNDIKARGTIWAPTFTAVLFTTPKIGSQSMPPSTNEWVESFWCSVFNNELLFSFREGDPVICDNVDELRGHRV